MAYEEVVGEEWGNPHPYMSSMWDIFVPNPRGKKELQQNIFGAGYKGADISTVKEGRSPFGALLQGVGIIGEPDARPLTYYEQFLYEQGQKQARGDKFGTEKQELGNLQDALNLAQDYIDSGGDPEEMQKFMEFLPQSMKGGFKRQAQERGEQVEYQRSLQDLQLETGEENLEYNKLNRQVQQEKLRMERIVRNPAVQIWAKRYNDILKLAYSEDVRDPIQRGNILKSAEEVRKQLQIAIKQAGGDDVDVMELAGPSPYNPMAQIEGEPRDASTDTRHFRTEQDALDYFNKEGYPMPPSPYGIPAPSSSRIYP